MVAGLSHDLPEVVDGRGHTGGFSRKRPKVLHGTAAEKKRVRDAPANTVIGTSYDLPVVVDAVGDAHGVVWR